MPRKATPKRTQPQPPGEDGRVTWRFVLDEAGAREMEAARIASDERTRLALDKIRRINDVLPGREEQPYFQVTTETHGLLASVRVYLVEDRSVRDELDGRGKRG